MSEATAGRLVIRRPPDFAIALIEPEIPQNTGNIARLSVALGVELYLVKPLGFAIDESAVRRAGLDYWDKVRLTVFENLEVFERLTASRRRVGLDPRGTTPHHRFAYRAGDILCFGKESVGLARLPPDSIHIPMREDCRSLNLANSVAIVAYEAWKRLEDL
jgi:tRNA (cytidine/uridine-2'-O-)-methyltransferase